MTPPDLPPHPGVPALGEAIRRAVIQAGEAAYEDAGIQGLCAEGRWEAAVAAMRSLDVAAIARDGGSSAGERSAAPSASRARSAHSPAEPAVFSWIPKRNRRVCGMASPYGDGGGGRRGVGDAVR